MKILPRITPIYLTLVGAFICQCAASRETDECPLIETARCDLKARCQNETPLHFDQHFPTFSRDGCISDIQGRCHARQPALSGWDGVDLQACIDAIEAYPFCAELTADHDETQVQPLESACWFLQPLLDPLPTDTETWPDCIGWENDTST
ncbi:MAG: hypothetical protein QNJ97_12100 [Myxococcota bacterium]|nr:hypothetical protein [Myxococcota bacterium]